MAKRISSVAFKADHQKHGMLLLLSQDEFIGPDHPARIVSQVLDHIEIRLRHSFPGIGYRTVHLF